MDSEYVPGTKKLLYVSGPYRSKNGPRGVMRNILRAWYSTCSVWEGEYGKNYIPVSPHLNSMMMDGIETDDLFLEADLELLARCDAILMMLGYSESEGAKIELEYAKKWGKVVIYEEI